MYFTAPFPGYTTIPAIPTTQNQTFVFSPLSVINSQPSILPAHSQSTVSAINQQQKTNEMHKVLYIYILLLVLYYLIYITSVYKYINKKCYHN